MVGPSGLFTLLRYTHAGIGLAHGLRRLLCPNRFPSEFAAQADPGSRPAIDPKLGYLGYRFLDGAAVSAAIEYAAAAFPKSQGYSRGSKAGVLNVQNVDIDDPRHRAIRELALHEEILMPVARYLMAPPVLLSAMVWNSPNETQELKASQLFHFDREDVRQIKCFVPIEPIDGDTGALCVLDAVTSKTFVRKTWARGRLPTSKKRYSDEEVYRAVSPDKLRSLTGDAGDILMVDTTSCLHYGSRPAKRGKYHLTMHYVSPHSQRVRAQELPALDVRASLSEMTAAMYRARNAASQTGLEAY